MESALPKPTSTRALIVVTTDLLATDLRVLTGLTWAGFGAALAVAGLATAFAFFCSTGLAAADFVAGAGDLMDLDEDFFDVSLAELAIAVEQNESLANAKFMMRDDGAVYLDTICFRPDRQIIRQLDLRNDEAVLGREPAAYLADTMREFPVLIEMAVNQPDKMNRVVGGIEKDSPETKSAHCSPERPECATFPS
jgi:hypothetical protein